MTLNYKDKELSGLEACLVVIVLIFFGILGLIFKGWAVMLLWNWLMPIFGLVTINFWKSVGIIFLADLLFVKHINTSDFKVK